MLMDDVLDKKDNTHVGGPHPHAGFETVTLLLEGEFGDDEHTMKAGDLQIMTAGSGIVHTETIDKEAHMQLLQLWITLPKKHRWAEPRVQNLPFAQVPKLKENGAEIRVYSGSFAGLTSPIQNYVPFIIADIYLESGASTVQQLPANHNTFLYVIEGELDAGEEKTLLRRNHVGWLDKYADNSASELSLKAGENGAHVVLYSGEPQGEDIVSYGPFIGDTREDIQRLYHEYNRGKMRHVSTLPAAQNFNY
jgi:redox-sensitive bicupin YhaK (pirin superfamily)